ncbi:flagellar basal body-associated FliL family protein [Marinomonas arenicola]|uniref:flagellar basal body-associated FliL family protein n=1 Tax=Marinomonas arenicola TaxID=569601 RepID=UPI00311EFA6B
MSPITPLKQFFALSLIITSLLSTFALAADEENTAQPAYVELTPDFIVNYTTTSNRLKYIKTSITLQTDVSHEAIIQDNMPLIRDALVMFLSSRTDEQVSGAQAREKTREEAAVAINAAMKAETNQEPVKSVLFASFLTQ